MYIIKIYHTFFSQAMEVEVPNIPHIPSKGVHRVPFRPHDLYIERNDFREVCFISKLHLI